MFHKPGPEPGSSCPSIAAATNCDVYYVAAVSSGRSVAPLCSTRPLSSRSIRSTSCALTPRCSSNVAFSHSSLLQVRTAPDLSRLHHRVRGSGDGDSRAPAVDGGHHGLHRRRHSTEKARCHRSGCALMPRDGQLLQRARHAHEIGRTTECWRRRLKVEVRQNLLLPPCRLRNSGR